MVINKEKKLSPNQLFFPQEENNTGEIVIYDESVESKEMTISKDEQNRIEEIEDDFQTSRNAIRDILLTSSNALDNALELARESESPRAMEVASNMMAMISSVAKDLMEVNERYDKLKTKAEPKENNTGANPVFNNNVWFEGSTKALLDALKNNN